MELKKEGLPYYEVVRIQWNAICEHISHSTWPAVSAQSMIIIISIILSLHKVLFKTSWIYFIQTVSYSTNIYQETTTWQNHARCKYRIYKYVYQRKHCMLIIYYRSDIVLGILETLFHLILIRALQTNIIIVILQINRGSQRLTLQRGGQGLSRY